MADTKTDVPAECNCLAVRQVARYITQFYDQHLAAAGLRRPTGLGAVALAERICGEADRLDPARMSRSPRRRWRAPSSPRSRIVPKILTTRSERTYRCRRMRRFGVMCAEQGACVRRQSWAGYTINMFEFESPTGTRAKRKGSAHDRAPMLGPVTRQSFGRCSVNGTA
jgi:hypothetical protein